MTFTAEPEILATTPAPPHRRVTRFISGNVVELDDDILNQLDNSQGSTPNTTAEPEILEEVATPPAAAPKYNRCVNRFYIWQCFSLASVLFSRRGHDSLSLIELKRCCKGGLIRSTYSCIN